MDINFIIIYDNTAQAKVLFVTESVTEVLGYTADELYGTCGYEITHPDEREALGVAHKNNVTNEHLSTVTIYRSRHKDGHYVLLDIVIHYCFDTLVCTCYAVSTPDTLKRKLRLNSADIVYHCQPTGELFINGIPKDARVSLTKHMENKSPWGDNQAVQLQQEPRFCLIVNRYTEKAIIVFATKICEMVAQTSPYELIGKSLYDYIEPSDRASVDKQIQLSKSSELISRLRFAWKVGENKYISMEAIVSCTYDGVVLVGRAAHPVNSIYR